MLVPCSADHSEVWPRSHICAVQGRCCLVQAVDRASSAARQTHLQLLCERFLVAFPEAAGL